MVSTAFTPRYFRKTSDAGMYRRIREGERAKDFLDPGAMRFELSTAYVETPQYI
jgi:hypothetical protein